MFFERKIKLDQVSIAAPCPIKWEKMEGDSHIRFCSACNVNVYNISTMTRKEAEQFLSNQSGPLCLRLYRRKDGTIITKDCPIGQRIASRVKRQVHTIVASAVAILNASAVFGQVQKQKLPQEMGKIDAPTNQSIFQVEPTVLDGRFYTSGRAERHMKTSPTLPEGAPIPFEPEQKNRPDATVYDAFVAAQQYDASRQPDRALQSYEAAINALRNSKVVFDKQFGKKVATSYARLLRKKKRFQKAKAIEEEFVNAK